MWRHASKIVQVVIRGRSRLGNELEMPLNWSRSNLYQDRRPRRARNRLRLPSSVRAKRPFRVPIPRLDRRMVTSPPSHLPPSIIRYLTSSEIPCSRTWSEAAISLLGFCHMLLSCQASLNEEEQVLCGNTGPNEVCSRSAQF